jgi:SAM-dependent methyltransferase
VKWARTPGHDAYWQYRDAFFDQIVPHPGRCTLEVGCGEGRVARDLSQRGHRVVAIDRSRRLLNYARDADPEGTYLLANAVQLPVADAGCDLVVAYNSLMDVADLLRTISEAARVLESGGHFCVCMTHPLSNAGRFVSSETGAGFEIAGSYFGRRKFESVEARDGLTMAFRGWGSSLEEYVHAFEHAGLLIESLREPMPVATTGHYANWHRVPMFLTMRLVKP